MPLYEYRCSTCGQVFELLRRFSDADRDLVCPQCQSEEIERLLSAFASTAGGCASRPGRRFT
ncbi:MAG: zinc ribbon domain-containing protein [Acidobacteriota bacterium]